ncbi:hypothetical protein A8C75_15835 [Marinobacterium aestuarii]|uniref:Uncharacterized protein n=1 Tax=Marinobacterium aestuarii TaxID=1821621 RepID=A0A1A9F1C8_9GAMM|nr:hypothetical protein [Marinobacterium aestuarii]ANG63800.1 hypothetical protein A8C75_15835 [Marinobacterium aestuarii]
MKLIPGIQKLFRTLRQGCAAAVSIDRHTLRDIGADPMRIHYPVSRADSDAKAQELWRQAC